MLRIDRPPKSEYHPFYENYIAMVPQRDLLSLLESQNSTLRDLTRRLPANGGLETYAPGKWTVREVFGHLVDAERLFGFRAFRISRGDSTELPGFDEKFFVENSNASETPVAETVREFALVRSSNLAFLSKLNQSQWEQIGNANGSRISVRAIGYVMAGHVQHHLGILTDRYGLPVQRR